MKGVCSLTNARIVHRFIHPDNIAVCGDLEQPVFKIMGFMEATNMKKESVKGKNSVSPSCKKYVYGRYNRVHSP